MMTSETTEPKGVDRFSASEKAHAVAELRTWFQLDTWTVREGLLLLVGIDPYRSEDLVFTESGISSTPNPSWARITARPGLSVDEVDAAGWPRITGYVLDLFQIEQLSRLLNLWVSKPGHTLKDRHAPSYYLEWANGKDCNPFWHPWVIEAGLFSNRPTECRSATVAAEPARASADPLTIRQDKRLALLRQLGGDVTQKNGGLIVKGITQLVHSEAEANAPARTEKTIRADLKAAYVREVEAGRAGPFDKLGSR